MVISTANIWKKNIYWKKQFYHPAEVTWSNIQENVKQSFIVISMNEVS